MMSAYPHKEKTKKKDPKKKDSVDEPLMTRMGGTEPARFLVSEEKAEGWAPIKTPECAEGKISLYMTSDLKKREWALEILRNPPKAPFLAASIGQSFADTDYWEMTLSQDYIVFGGSGSIFGGSPVVGIERNRFWETVDWFTDTGVNVFDMLRDAEIVQRHKTGQISGEQARAQRDRIKADRSVLKSFPGERHPEIMKLASLAAQEPQMEKTHA